MKHIVVHKATSWTNGTMCLAHLGAVAAGSAGRHAESVARVADSALVAAALTSTSCAHVAHVNKIVASLTWRRCLLNKALSNAYTKRITLLARRLPSTILEKASVASDRCFGS